jgi:acid phosphatase type 7
MKRAVSFVIRTSVLLLAVFASALAADAAVSIIKGPYLQNPTSTSLVIMWQTTEPSDSRVELGPTQSYTRHLYDPALRQVHEVLVSDLAPDTLYHYRVAPDTATGSVSSSDNTLRTAVTPGTPFRFAV